MRHPGLWHRKTRLGLPSPAYAIFAKSSQSSWLVNRWMPSEKNWTEHWNRKTISMQIWEEDPFRFVNSHRRSLEKWAHEDFRFWFTCEFCLSRDPATAQSGAIQHINNGRWRWSMTEHCHICEIPWSYCQWILNRIIRIQCKPAKFLRIRDRCVIPICRKAGLFHKQHQPEGWTQKGIERIVVKMISLWFLFLHYTILSMSILESIHMRSKKRLDSKTHG
jgi:hypothetical protein